jgi:hypothetical protein
VLHAPLGQASASARMCWWLLGLWLRVLVPPHSHCGPSCVAAGVRSKSFKGLSLLLSRVLHAPCVRLSLAEVGAWGCPATTSWWTSDPVPVPVANQRCTLSIGAWERCCGFPIDWETELRLHLPAVAFELHDLHDRVCPWVPEAPAPAGAGSSEPRPRGLPSSRIERALLTFPQEHAWDVVFAVQPHTSGTYPPEVLSEHHKLVCCGAQKSLRQLL